MDALRRELTKALDGVGAHMPLDEAVADFPEEAINGRAPNVDYTPWHLLEHIRLTQADILEYVTSSDYREKSWPRDYWPDPASTTTRDGWNETLRGFRADLAALKALVADSGRDLLAVIPGSPGHTLLREVRIVADHNAYHVGEFAILRQVMGSWPAGH
ncbi:MAG: DinB family protein [Chloroflexota bacterium]